MHNCQVTDQESASFPPGVPLLRHGRHSPLSEDAAIAHSGGRQGGKPGRSNTLRKGERETIEQLNAAIAEVGDDDPVVQMCMEILCRMAHGSGLRRHSGDQYRAIRELLDRRQGTPTQKVQHGGEISHRVTIVDDPDGAG